MIQAVLIFLLMPTLALSQSQWNENGDNTTSGRVLLAGPTSSTDYDDISITRNKASAGIKLFNGNQAGRAVILFGEGLGGKYGFVAHHGQSYSADPLYTQTHLPASTILVGSDVNGLGVISKSDIRFTAGGLDDSKQRMIIKSNGNVGIGTSVPDEALAVNGTIHAEEIKVDVNVPEVPDYVFESVYELLSLPALEAYVRKNKHLPEVPSSREMQENGILLKEMNLLLLKKVEELTLHLISQDKARAEQADQIRELKVELNDLRKELRKAPEY